MSSFSELNLLLKPQFKNIQNNQGLAILLEFVRLAAAKMKNNKSHCFKIVIYKDQPI